MSGIQKNFRRLFDGAGDPQREAIDLELEQGRVARTLVREYELQGAGWFWQTDRAGALTYLSEKVAGLLESSGRSVLGSSFANLFQCSSDEQTSRTLAFHLSSRTSFTDLPVGRAGDADNQAWSISGRPLFDELGHFKGFAGSGSNLSDKRLAEAEITKLALFDSLTGLANRQRMKVALDQACARGRASYRVTSLLLLDLDRFKAVNDTLGHQVGDDLLHQVAQRLQRSVGDAGLVGRLGGDEFQVLLSSQCERERVAELAEAIIVSLSHPYFISGSSVSIGCSIGIAIGPEDGEDADTLVRSADLALYAAKAAGRGVHRFYRSQMLSGAQHRKKLEDELRTSLAQNQLRVVYQPVVSTDQPRIVGYEALLRWDHPSLGPISPAEFIPIAEECGLIESLGEWVLRTATQAASAWPPHVRVAVNVSPIQFANPRLPALVTSALAAAGIEPARLELEITEGVFINKSSASERMFDSLKGLGVRLALDDFGTGYSSLSYLQTAPFDKIKIDQSFVRGAAIVGSRNGAIIKAIVMLADSLNMETTAEGVELQDEIELIKELGCSHIQGFVYGKPIPQDEVLVQLAESGHTLASTGYAVSRSPRTTVLRRALLKVGPSRGHVRIRNISTKGALIDGIQLPPESVGGPVLIELTEEPMIPGKIRWARDGQAGVEFDEAFDLEKFNGTPNNFGVSRLRSSP